MAQKVSDFSKIKNIIERQILNTLDFLFTDNQINAIQVVQISRLVLTTIGVATTQLDLFRNLRLFVNSYPLFKDNLSKTIIALNASYGNR